MAWEHGDILAVENPAFAPEPNLSGIPHYLDKLPEPSWLKDIDQGNGGFRGRWTPELAEVERLYAVPWGAFKIAIDYLLGYTTALPSPGNPNVARLQRIIPHQDGLMPWLFCSEVRLERGAQGLTDATFTRAQNFDGTFINRSEQSQPFTSANPTGGPVAGAPAMPPEEDDEPPADSVPLVPVGVGVPPALPAAQPGAVPPAALFTSRPGAATAGQIVTLSLPAFSPPLPAGRVVFYDGATQIGAAPAAVPTIAVAFAAGLHFIEAQFLPSNPAADAPTRSSGTVSVAPVPDEIPPAPAPRRIRLSYPQYLDDAGDQHFEGVAFIRAIYRDKPYEVRPDWERDVYFKGSELCRWISVKKRFAVSGVPIGKVVGSLLQFIAGPYSTPPNNVVPEGGLLLIPTAHIEVTWHEVPDFPEAAYAACLGKVNATVIQFDQPGGPVYQPGTLLCQPCEDPQPARNVVGRRTKTITFHFDWKPQGWNSFPAADGNFYPAAIVGASGAAPNAGFLTRVMALATGAPATPPAGARPVFLPAEFAQLFTPPGPVQWH